MTTRLHADRKARKLLSGADFNPASQYSDPFFKAQVHVATDALDP
jgi:hypothetical protein